MNDTSKLPRGMTAEEVTLAIVGLADYATVERVIAFAVESAEFASRLHMSHAISGSFNILPAFDDSQSMRDCLYSLSLLRRWQESFSQGDECQYERVLEEIVGRYGAEARAMVLEQLPRLKDVTGLLEDVLRSMHDKLSTFEPLAESFRTWFLTQVLTEGVQRAAGEVDRRIAEGADRLSDLMATPPVTPAVTSPYRHQSPRPALPPARPQGHLEDERRQRRPSTGTGGAT